MPDLPDLVDEFMKTLKIKGEVAVLNKPGAVLLNGYPGLVYAPAQHGPGIRTEDKGVPVSAICDDVVAGLTFEAIAAKHGTTVDHVADAIRYAEATGYVGEA